LQTRCIFRTHLDCNAVWTRGQKSLEQGQDICSPRRWYLLTKALRYCPQDQHRRLYRPEVFRPHVLRYLAGCCEYGKEQSYDINGENLLKTSQEGFGSVEFECSETTGQTRVLERSIKQRSTTKARQKLAHGTT